MPLVPLKEITDHSYKHEYAVGAFNVINFDFFEAIITAAEQESFPVILNIAEVHFPFINLEMLCPAIIQRAINANVNVALNLDHGISSEAFQKAIDHGFTSVMFDGSNLSYEKNIEETFTIVKQYHPINISVEAELGAVGGDEGGAIYSKADPNRFTDPDQAAEFVKKTNIDCLAVAIGNSHGKYKGKPKLDFDRLKAINDAAKIPLVLHGGSGISDDDFRKAISLGISKINFFTGMAEAALLATKASIEKSGTSYNDYPKLVASVKQSVTEVVAERIRVFSMK